MRVNTERGKRGSSDGTEVNLTAILTYYSKWNQAELGRLFFLVLNVTLVSEY